MREKMDDENASCAHDMENAHLSLLDLPVEIFLHICSFLDTPTLVHSLSLMCKQFYLILMDDLLWKERINRIWPDASHSLLYPVRPDKLFWMSSCVAIEKQRALWKQQDSMEKLINAGALHCSGVTALLLMHDGATCIAGAEYGELVYWKLPSCEKLPSDKIRNTVCIKSAHDGCISGLTAIDNTIYSCSRAAGIIKSWMLTDTSLVRQTTYETNVQWPTMCMASCPERSLLATGSSRGTVFVFDSRSHNLIRQYQPHTGRVRNLAMSTDYILSASEDETVSVWDQRAGRTMKSITIPDEAVPTCISMQRGCVFVGDNKAKCHMLNPKNDFELVKSYFTEHTQWITGVHLTHGCLITSSRDGTVRISSPTDPPKPLATLHSAFETIENMDYLNDTLAISGGDTIAMDYLNDTLAIFGDNDVAVWRMK